MKRNYGIWYSYVSFNNQESDQERKCEEMKKKKVMGILLLALCMVLGLCACQKKEETKEEPKTEETDVDYGVLKVGMDGAHAPYCAVNEESGELEGFEVDVMNEVSERTGLKMELEVASWDGIFGMLDSGQLTTIACSVEPNDERREKYDFTDNYIEIRKAFAVAKGKGGEIATMSDLDGLKVGCRAGGNSVEHLETIMKDEGINFEIVPYDGGGMEYDLSLGRLDAVYSAEISLQTIISEGEFEIEMSSIDPINPSYCAYPFAKDGENTDALIELFNGALEEMKEDGTLVKLSEKWFNIDATCK